MKNVSEAFIEALKLISERYRIHNINWILVGSLSLALNGVDVIPNDIDILTDEKGALKSNKIFEEYLIKRVEWSETKIYKSFFGKFTNLSLANLSLGKKMYYFFFFGNGKNALVLRL